MIAVVLSFLFAQQDAENRQKKLAAALVVACQGDSRRTALNAAGFSAMADQTADRGSKGDAKTARRYRAVATGVATLIPAPIGREGDANIARVHLIDRPGQEPRFIITKNARALQLQGCKDFYGVG